MARRLKRPIKTTALSDAEYDNIINVIDSLCNRMLCAIEIDLTWEDALSIVCSPEDAEVLKKASSIAQVPSSCFTTGHVHVIQEFDINEIAELPPSPYKHIMIERGGIGLSLRFNVVDGKSMLLPKYPQTQKLNPDLRRILNDYVQARVNFGADWGRVKWVVRMLNSRCRTPAQMRYVFPAILGLMNANYKLKAMANKLAEHKVPRIIPNLNPHERAVVRNASATIAAGLMMPDVRGSETRQVTILGFENMIVREHGIEFYTM